MKKNTKAMVLAGITAALYVALTMISTLVILAVTSNVILSLGMVGMETGLLLVSAFLSLLVGFLAPIGLLLTAWRLGRKGE